jgi:hypothetical protein
LLVGDALHEMLRPSAVALMCTAVGGSGGGSRMMMLSVVDPLVAVTVMLLKTPPDEVNSVTTNFPVPSVTPLNVVVRVGNATKLPRLPASVVMLNETLALLAATPPSKPVAVMVVLAPAAMSVLLAESDTLVGLCTVIGWAIVAPPPRMKLTVCAPALAVVCRSKT